MWSPSSSSVGFCAHNKKICGNCRVSPRDGLFLISSPYEVSSGIWQVLYEAGNPRWRFLLSWNILSAIVHQRGRCALLDDPCHCLIKLIISFNSLVTLAVFSKNLSVPVLWLVERGKSSISVIYWQNTLWPIFLCSSFVVEDGIITEAWIGSSVGEPCALHYSLEYMARG